MSSVDTALASIEPAQQTGIDIPGEGAAGAGAAAPVEREDHPVAEAPAAPADDVEQRAKAMGWVPKEDYKGPAENWRDAAEFVRRGEEELPIMRERNRDLARKLADIETKFSQQIQAVQRTSTIALQRQREQLMANYEAALRDAVSVGDTERYDTVRRDYGQALHQFDAQAQPMPQQQARQPVMSEPEQREISDWERSNPWYGADPELNAAAQMHHVRLQREKPNLSLKENLAETARAVKSQFADRFGSARPTVEGGGGVGGSRMANPRPRQKTGSDLPASVRAVADSFIKQGLFKDHNDYAKEYFSQEGA